MKSNKIIVELILIVAAIIGGFLLLRGKDTKAPEQTQSNSQSTSPTNNTNSSNTQPSMTDYTPVPGCTRSFDPAKLQIAIETKNQFVTLDVKDFGSIKVQLYDTDAPKTVESFLKLTNAGYYDCLTFHRVSKGFVIQGGDPTGTGSGGQSAFGGEFADELNTETESYKTGYVKGVLAMANHGKNTNGSQFFILLGDAPNLPHLYTMFGKVVAGQEVVDKIGQVDIFPGPFGPDDGTPKTKVVITKATITK